MKRNVFKSLGEFRASSLWAKLSGGKPKANTHVLRATRLEDMIYRDLRERDDSSGLDEIEEQGAKRLDSFPSLIQDTFQSLYSLNPRRNDLETLTANARQFNAEILDSVMTSEEYPTLKSLCEGRELPSFEALDEFTGQLLEKLDELLDAAGGDKNSLNVLNKLERQQEQIKEDILKSMSAGADDKALALATKAESKDRQIGRLSEMIGQNLRKGADQLQTAISSAMTAATEKAQEISDILASWGGDDASPEAMKQNRDLLRRVQGSEKLKSIAKYLGKYRELLDNARRNSFTFGRGDKYDVTLGNDFTRAVSSEYAYLAIPEAIPLFIQKVRRKALKQYRRRERISKGYGDMIVCIDESSSMRGDPIAWAKAVALALLDFAARNGRSCAMVQFASRGSVRTHVFDKASPLEDIFAFAESFLNGGTDFEEPLTTAVGLIEQGGFRDADIVFLTDGECAISEEFEVWFREQKERLRFTVKGILMDADTPGFPFSLAPFCEKVYRLSEMGCNEVAGEVIRT